MILQDLFEESFQLKRTRVFKNPTRSQLKALTENARMNLIRGELLKEDRWNIYVWAAYSLGHWNFLNDIHNEGSRYSHHISLFLSNDLENLKKNKDWAKSEVQEANGFYFCTHTTPLTRPLISEAIKETKVLFPRL